MSRGGRHDVFGDTLEPSMSILVESSPVIDLIVWTQVAATLFLTGLIWVIQVVHYPLMSRVAKERFPEFHGQHSRRIGSLVIAVAIKSAG
jgi:hypothetical protein